MKSAADPVVLPDIPHKRYFAIGEVSELCAVKPHVLRYWEQEFPQLKPVKRRGNRRYYQQDDVLLVRRIRNLLYDQGFTITGARQKLKEMSRTPLAANDEPTHSAVPTTQEARRRALIDIRGELEDLLKHWPD